MRSWLAIAPSSAGTRRVTTPVDESRGSSGRSGDLSLRAIDGLNDDPPRIGSIPPMTDPHPLLGLEILIVGEEMLDLLEHDRRQIMALADVGIVRECRIHRDTDQLLVTPVFVLEVEDTDRPRTNDAAGHEGRARDDQRVERI